MRKRFIFYLRCIRALTTAAIILCITSMELILRRTPRTAFLQSVLGRSWTMLAKAAGGGFIKFGQIISTRADLFGAPFLQPLRELQDQAGDMPLSTLMTSLPASTSEKLRENVAELSEHADYAAAIAQIHFGVLRRSRSPVAVKLIRPKMRYRMFADMMLLRSAVNLIAKLPKIENLPLKRATLQMSYGLIQQFNLSKEARVQEYFGTVFHKNPHVYVPKVYKDICTKSMLVMEYIPGMMNIGDVEAIDEKKITRLWPYRFFTR